MECEVCGRQIYGRAHKVIIDGAKLLVCSGCTQFTPSRWSSDTNTQQATPRPRPPRRQSKPRPRQELIADNFVLINGYGNRIRKARENLGLTHKELSRKIGEKISLLQKLETEKMIPDTILIKKLRQKNRSAPKPRPTEKPWSICLSISSRTRWTTKKRETISPEP